MLAAEVRPTEPSGAVPPKGTTTGRRRLDIQGLRAVAVLLVLAYHLRPDLVPGGFVGVDVFFVISGYLIIGSLVREAAGTGRVALLRFYAHRTRRLLPLSATVIVATLAVGLLVLPPTRWGELGRSAVLSALQLQNLDLAFGLSEYQAASAAVSPYQHFWSLSIEEQFYLVVPVLVLAVVLLGRRLFPDVRRGLLVLFGVVLALSLAWSVYYGATGEGAAPYYVTTTRVWELALGGILAILALRPRTRWAAGLWAGAGLALVCGSAFLLHGTDGYPGALALLPVVGTAMAIHAGAAERPNPVSAALGTVVPRTVGDVSYSLYLWHWPVIVYVVVLTEDASFSLPVAALIALGCTGLALLSERFIERPFRKPWRSWRSRTARHRRRGPVGDRATVAVGLAAVLVVVAVSVAPVLHVRQVAAAALADPPAGGYPGAAVLTGDVDGRNLPEAPVRPAAVSAADDIPPAYTDGCNGSTLDQLRDDATLCRYGAGTGGPTGGIALVGDSHAAQLASPLSEVAAAEGLSARLYFKDGCPFSLGLGAWPEQSCVPHNEQLLDVLAAERPDVVVVANLSRTGYRDALQWGWPSEEEAVAGFESAWRPLLEAGTQVVYVRSLPYPTLNVPDCVASHGRDAARCAFEPDGATDYGAVAAEDLGVPVIDLRDAICGKERCEPVVGNVLVYRDNHLTDTYARSLAPELSRALADVIG